VAEEPGPHESGMISPGEGFSEQSAQGFCSYPFQSLNIMPTGTIKPCCAFNDLLREDGRPLSIYEHTLDDIWNSKALRDLRRDFVEGREVKNCDGCFELERQGLESTRTHRQRWLNHGFCHETARTVEQIKAEFVESDFVAHRQPECLDLDVGNTCNLKCRMCNSTYSSGIAQDPVHSRWQPLPLLATPWKNGELSIGPRPILGAAYSGFQEVRSAGKTFTAWTNGNASIRLGASESSLASFSVRLNPDRPDGLNVSIKANTRTVFSGPVPKGDWEQRFDLFDNDQEELIITVESPLFKPTGSDERVGVGIDEIKLIRQNTSAKEMFNSRFETGVHWFQEPAFRQEELLADPSSLQMINFIGGEPLLIKEVRDVMKRLIDLGAASKIMLVLTTNGTCGDDEWFSLAKEFKGVYMAVSVDGYEAINDYIRFPSKWAQIADKLSRLASQANCVLDLNATVQAYNVLNIVDLLDYCDRNSYSYRLTLLQTPRHLSPFIFPIEIRRIAATRLREYVDRSTQRLLMRELGGLVEPLRTDCRDAALAVANALEGGSTEADLPELKRFMQMTNDLDRSRGQDIRQGVPDLVQAMDEHGISWSDETLFFATKLKAH